MFSNKNGRLVNEMNANIIFIKLKSGCKAVQHFEDSYKDVKSEKDYFYNIGNDNENAENKVLPFVSEECYIVALECEKKIFSKKDDNAYDIKNCYLGIGKPIKNQKGVSPYCVIRCRRWIRERFYSEMIC